MPPSQLAKLAEEADATMLIASMLARAGSFKAGGNQHPLQGCGALRQRPGILEEPKVSALVRRSWPSGWAETPKPATARGSGALVSLPASRGRTASMHLRLPALEAAGAGGGWPRRNAREAWLARVILLDQLPRHCFRGWLEPSPLMPAARESPAGRPRGSDEAHHAPAQTLFLTMPFRHSEAWPRYVRYASATAPGCAARGAMPRRRLSLIAVAARPTSSAFAAADDLAQRSPGTRLDGGRRSAPFSPSREKRAGSSEIAMPLGDPCLAGVVPLLGPLWRTPMTSDERPLPRRDGWRLA